MRLRNQIQMFEFFVGTWSAQDGLNLTRVQEVTEFSNPINIMANKTYVVTLKEVPPYTMLKEEVSQLV
jgi:hypothetical protein